MTPAAAMPAVAPPRPLGLPDEDAPGRRERIGRLRDVRGRLRAAALGGTDGEVEAALAAFVALAWEAGFSRATATSSAAAALEEGLRKRRRRGGSAPLVGALAQWTSRARRHYDGLTGAAGTDAW